MNELQSLGKLLERDRMFTERLTRETAGLHLTGLAVDADTKEDGQADRVTDLLGLGHHR
ncbi:hypothetical protein ACIBL3_16530 [Kribbella sp. NPDC050124]|uniref:hypothetical protein n=1 Tax=Kribbella sp. NPDC050124 TaxID=3364114 RepID=UPI00379B095B